ncbi:rvb2 [Symbiodinium pilosum]|uniref:RuvB-like helicase n=1 Tax=Symbiodinium pilosum TaxID=2952 RepID=A0A812Y561_SYMPI|nr:rvb2 [Symbiodinium pilosum]
MAPIPWSEADPFSISMYAQESAYWSSLQENETLMRLCTDMTAAAARSNDAVEAQVEQLCKLCWASALEAVDCHTLLIAARAEVDHLKRRLSRCSLAKTKQLIFPEDELPRSDRSRFEGRSFMDQDQRDLVFSAAWDEFRDEGPPPRGDSGDEIPVLLDIGVNTEEAAEDTANLRRSCEELQSRLTTAEAEAVRLQGDVSHLEEQLCEAVEETRAAKGHLAEALEQLTEAQSAEAMLQGAYEKLQEEHELEIKLHEDSRHEVARLQSEVIRYRTADVASQDKKALPSGRRPSRRPLNDSRPPSSPLPLLAGSSVSFSDAAATLREVESPGFTLPNRRKAMQVSTSLPSLQRSGAESQGQSSLLTAPRSKRRREEDVEMTEEAKELLTKIGTESTLRYAIHLITCSNLVAMKRKAQEVDVQDIRKVYSLFVDVKRSTQFLMEYQQEFMFSEVHEEEDRLAAQDLARRTDRLEALKARRRPSVLTAAVESSAAPPLVRAPRRLSTSSRVKPMPSGKSEEWHKTKVHDVFKELDSKDLGEVSVQDLQVSFAKMNMALDNETFAKYKSQILPKGCDSVSLESFVKFHQAVWDNQPPSVRRFAGCPEAGGDSTGSLHVGLSPLSKSKGSLRQLPSMKLPGPSKGLFKEALENEDALRAAFYRYRQAPCRCQQDMQICQWDEGLGDYTAVSAIDPVGQGLLSNVL